MLVQQAQREANESGKALYLVERDMIGFDYARVASELMKNWELPDSLVTVVENHLEPDPDAEYLLDAAIVHVAAKIADAFSEDRPLDEALVETNRHAWDATGLDIARCEAVNAEVSEQLKEVINMLFPNLQKVAV